MGENRGKKGKEMELGEADKGEKSLYLRKKSLYFGKKSLFLQKKSLFWPKKYSFSAGGRGARSPERIPPGIPGFWGIPGGFGEFRDFGALGGNFGSDRGSRGSGKGKERPQNFGVKSGDFGFSRRNFAAGILGIHREKKKGRRGRELFGEKITNLGQKPT